MVSCRFVALACLMALALGGVGTTPSTAATVNETTGELELTPAENPTNVQPLPPPMAGEPLFDRRPEGLPVGLDTSNARNRYWKSWEENGNQQPPIETELAEIVARAHLDFARVQAPWYVIEPDAPTSDGPDYHWGILDRTYVETIRAGVRPVIQIFASPRWAVGYKSGDANVAVDIVDSGCSGNFCKQAPDELHYDEFGAFAGELAVRYPLAAALEVWNEPNLWQFWHARNVDPAGYTELLRTVFDATMSRNPAMRVLGGVFNPHQRRSTPAHCQSSEHTPLQRLDCETKRDWSHAEFLAGMLDAGAQNVLHGLSIHAKADKTLPDELRRFRDLYNNIDFELTRRNLPRLRIVQSESGASVSDSPLPPADAYSQSEQSRVMQRQYQFVSNPRPEDNPPPGIEYTDAILFFESLDVVGRGWLCAPTRNPLTGRFEIRARPVYNDMGDLFGTRPNAYAACPVGL